VAELLDRAEREADRIRSAAHEAADRIMAEALVEVTAFNAQRDAIARELSALSGIIDALAVPAPAFPNGPPLVPEVAPPAKHSLAARLDEMMRDQ